MEREIERFNATDDAGNIYQVIILQEDIVIETRAGVQHCPGMKRAITSTGDSLNRIAEDTFKFVHTGTRIRKM